MEPPIEDRPRELRIAPVMTGGTSLAVWMGGATLELYRVTRACAEPGVTEDGIAIYRRLLELTHTRAVIDVITGTSAGGLNGTLLAAAQTFDLSIDGFAGIRSTWQDTADIDDLLRSRKEPDPPSLLQGDAYFERQIAEVLTQFAGNGPAAASTDDAPPSDTDHDVDLVTTLTTIVPVKKTRFDAFGEAIVESDHAHHLRFTGEQIRAGEQESITRLAIAARTSAGIPGVFEPSFIPIGASDAGATNRPDFGAHASFNLSRWAVDGGVVVNLPLTEALDRVYERTAVGEVRRVVLYVNPTPAVETPDRADAVTPMPSLRRSVSTIVTAPRAEGISDDLDQIDRRNRQIDRQSQTRVALGALGSTIKLSEPGYEEYRRRRAASIEHLLAVAYDANPALAERDALTERLVASRLKLFPAASDRIDRPAIGTFPERRWGWGIEPLDHAVSTALGLVSRALALTDQSTEDDRILLLGVKADLHHYRARLTAVHAVDQQFWARRFEAFGAGTDPGDADEWHGAWPYQDATDLAIGAVMFERAQAPNAAEAAAAARVAPGAEPVDISEAGPTPDDLAMQYPGSIALGPAPGGDSGSGRVRDPMESARNAVFEVLRGAHFETARLIMTAAPAILRVTERARAVAAEVLSHDRSSDSPGHRAAAALDTRATALAEETASVCPPDAEKAAIAARSLRLHQVQVLLLGDVVQREQRVSVVQLSSNRPAVATRLANRTSADKLAGPELARLGAFLKPSWRANDWFWGRMDAAHRLVLLLLDPLELKRQGNVEEFTAWLRDLTEAEPPAAVTDEISRLEHAAAPEALPHTAAFLAEQIQLAIARTELPHIADAIDATIERNGNEVDRGAFRRAVRGAFPVAPGPTPADAHRPDPVPTPPSDDEIAGLVAKLQTGSETLADEVGYGLLTRVASRALTVTVNAISAPASAIPVAGRLLRPMRAPVRAVSALFELLTALDPTRRAIAAFLAAIAGAVLALRLLGGDVPAALVAASAAVFVVLIVTAALRSGLVLSGLVLAAAGLVITLTLLGSDLRLLLYDEIAPTTTTAATVGSSLTVDDDGVLRLTTGDGAQRRITDQPLSGGDVVTFRSTGGTLAGADTGPRTQGWKQLLFLGRPRCSDAPAALRATCGGDRGPVSVFNVLVVLGTASALLGKTRRRQILIVAAGLVTVVLSPLAFSTLLTGAEPVDGGGVKGWLVSVATTLHDYGLLLLLVLLVGAGVLLSLGYDQVRSRLRSQ